MTGEWLAVGVVQLRLVTLEFGYGVFAGVKTCPVCPRPATMMPMGAVFFLKTPPRLPPYLSLLRVKTMISSDRAATELSGATSFVKAPPWSPLYVTPSLVVC
jgi:hypothetical protein